LFCTRFRFYYDTSLRNQKLTAHTLPMYLVLIINRSDFPSFLNEMCYASIRATGLGDFSPIMRLLSLGVFFYLTEVANFFVLPHAFAPRY
jgi:hypothetical protein